MTNWFHQTLLAGTFLCMFIACAYDLYHRRRRGTANLSWPMVFTGLSLLALATIRFSLDVTYVFMGFVKHDGREDRLSFFENVRVRVFIAKNASLVTALLIGDCFLVSQGTPALSTVSTSILTRHRLIGAGLCGRRAYGLQFCQHYVQWLEHVRFAFPAMAHKVLTQTREIGCGVYPLWAYTHLPDQQIFTEVDVLRMCFVLSLISNTLSTCARPFS